MDLNRQQLADAFCIHIWTRIWAKTNANGNEFAVQKWLFCGFTKESTHTYALYRQRNKNQIKDKGRTPLQRCVCLWVKEFSDLPTKKKFHQKIGWSNASKQWS